MKAKREGLRAKGWAIALVCAACGDPGGETGNTIKIGMNVSLSGDLAQFGSTSESVAKLAIAEINAQGGVAGRPLELVSLDDGTRADTAAENTQAFIARGDIAAMIGPGFSGGMTASLPMIRDAELVTITGSATAPSLAGPEDGGFLFRDVPDDNYQGIAMAKYLIEIAVEPRVALVYQDDEYGVGLADVFRTEYEARGGRIAREATFAPSLETQAAVDAVMSEIAASGAPMVVLITFSGDGAKIIQTWDDSGELTDLRWFFTDGVRDSNFAAARPSALEGMRGTAATHARGAVFDRFADAYLQAHGEDITQEVFQANYYDAVFLIALALARQAQQFPGEPLGGARLRDALHEVAGPDPAGMDVRVAAVDWAAAADALAAGNDVDYDGASGPCDFDENGEAKGPVEVWRITAGMYVQDHHYEVEDLVGP